MNDGFPTLMTVVIVMLYVLVVGVAILGQIQHAEQKERIRKVEEQASRTLDFIARSNEMHMKHYNEILDELEGADDGR